MTGKFFAKRCYKALLEVPAGKVTTYREIAHFLGTRAYRAVGNAMNKNPCAPVVPCHRVVKSDGLVGGYAGGVAQKIKLLKDEGIQVRNGRVVDFQEKLYTFKRK
ncbi:MAG: MGMT family protein [Candidatus Dadabacteria bacterium]|nr:MAG: MGMT family protein [Candidatus Dadabacteria bacterium]